VGPLPPRRRAPARPGRRAPARPGRRAPAQPDQRTATQPGHHPAAPPRRRAAAPPLPALFCAPFFWGGRAAAACPPMRAGHRRTSGFCGVVGAVLVVMRRCRPWGRSRPRGAWRVTWGGGAAGGRLDRGGVRAGCARARSRPRRRCAAGAPPVGQVGAPPAGQAGAPPAEYVGADGRGGPRALGWVCFFTSLPRAPRYGLCIQS